MNRDMDNVVLIAVTLKQREGLLGTTIKDFIASHKNVHKCELVTDSFALTSLQRLHQETGRVLEVIRDIKE